MITTIYDVETILRAKDYRKSSISTSSTVVYWGVNDNKEQAIFITDANKELIFFKHDIERIRKMAFADIDDENVLLIIIGDKWTKSLKGKNCICINASDNSYRKNGCRNFKDVISSIDAVSNYYNLKSKLNRNTNGILVRNNYNALPVYLVVALLILCYLYNINNPYINAISSQRISSGEYKYLIYYMFNHASIRHLLSNIIALLSIGIPYIKRNGSIKFASIFFMGGIAAGLFSALGQANVQTVGASGAIFALLGATLADVIIIREYRSQITNIFTYAVITLIMSSFGYADNYAHIGGFVSGLIISAFLSSNIRVVDNIQQILLLKKIKKARGSAYERIYSNRSKDNLSRIYN